MTKASSPLSTSNGPTLVKGGVRVGVEVAAGRVVCRWDGPLTQRVNPLDEEVLLRVFQGEELVQEFRVEQLSQREFPLPAGSYRLQLGRFFKPEVALRTPLESSPSVTWIQDSPASHLIVWGELDWPRIQREIERVHRLDWEAECAVALRVVWGREGDLKQEWIPVPNRDHATLEGLIDELELAVVEARNSRILKTLFLAQRSAREPLEVFAEERFEVTGALPQVTLLREVVETDTLQLRAAWTALPAGRYRLFLERDGQQISEQGPVEASGDWIFPQLTAGQYRVQLKKEKGRKTWDSSEVTLPVRPTRLRLLPITERRAFAYWHVGREVWASLSEEFGELEGRVECFLQIASAVGKSLKVLDSFTRSVDVGSTEDYYLDLAPDLIYRARLAALIDGEHHRDLTEWSNPCQLGRLAAGRNPIQHKSEAQPSTHPSAQPLRGPTRIDRNSLGYLMLHLHAHLPFIADPVNFGGDEAWRPIGYPQEWYPEAVCDTYLPLLDTFSSLVEEGVDFRLSMDISPPLAAMMQSQRHASDVLSFLERLIRLAQLEVERTRREEPHYRSAALMHLRRYQRCHEIFLSYRGDLLAGFRHFQDLGKLEICTCVGTHPMLPLWMSEPSAIRGHCLTAAAAHEKLFGRPSEGIWLPECAYTPGVEPFLEEAGFRYTFSETHCVTRGDAPAEFGVNAPVYSKGSRLAIFPRDPETGKQVWSGDEGYPGDPDYLEFHIRGGPFKYNRITDRRGGHKEPYNPEWADNKAAQHAGHFLDCRNSRFEYLRNTMWKKPLIVAPYDAELFGHHWYEGPTFLYYLFKKLHYDQNRTELITPSAYLAANPTSQDMFCNVSSWGHEGTFEKWMYGMTSWMYRHAHEAAESLAAACSEGADNELQRRLLAQAARQFMVATSSDLPFVISNGHFVDRMKEQFCVSLRGLYELLEAYRKVKDGGEISEERLRSLELENCLFPDLDPAWFTRR